MPLTRLLPGYYSGTFHVQLEKDHVMDKPKDGRLINQHKLLAMGSDLAGADNTAGAANWPGVCKSDGEPATTRGMGRAPDAKKGEASDPGNPQVESWFDSDADNAPGMVKVAAYVRNKPGSMGWD